MNKSVFTTEFIIEFENQLHSCYTSSSYFYIFDRQTGNSNHFITCFDFITLYVVVCARVCMSGAFVMQRESAD